MPNQHHTRAGSDASAPVELGGVASAYRRVRHAILTGELAPGQRVSQVQLAARLGVGRPTLREALRMLQNEGLIQAEHNRQVRVAPLEMKDFEQLCALRLAVEPMAVRLSVPALTDQDLVELSAAASEHRQLSAGSDAQAAADAHRRFHALMFSRAGDRIRRMADELWQSAERYRSLMLSRQQDLHAVARLAEADHDAILEAALRRDGKRCADLVARHIAKVSSITFSVIDSGREPHLLRTAVDQAVAQ